MTNRMLLSVLLALSTWRLAPAEPVVHGQARQAAFARDSGAAQFVQFGRKSPAVGDEVEQKVSVAVRMATSLRQGNAIAEKSTTTVLNTQRRILTTVETDEGRTTAAKVHFVEATKQLAQTAENAPEPAAPSAPLAQPVAGKAYYCRREADDTLSVTYEEGTIPPENEFEIVARTMDAIGRANPVSEFLAGKRVKVGEKITLPNDAANRLLGMSDDFGRVQRFDLTLQKRAVQQGVDCAVFLASIEAAGTGSSQMRLQVEGPLIIEIAACRAREAHFSGPLAMSESRGSYSTAYQVLGTGKMTLSIVSNYRDAITR